MQQVMYHGFACCKLENELLSVLICPQKGADVLQITWKETDDELLFFSPEDARQWQHGRYPRTYSQWYCGGWQEIIANRAIRNGKVVDPESEGESCVVAWQASQRGKDLLCSTFLPILQLKLTRCFSLQLDGLVQTTEITNMGEGDIHLMMTHHPAFSYAVFGEDTEVDFPGDWALKVNQVDRCAFEKCQVHTDCFPLPTGETFDLHRPFAVEQAPASLFTAMGDLRCGEAGLYSPKKRLGIRLCWDLAEMGYLRYWVSADPQRHTVALEPSTSDVVEIQQAQRLGRDCVIAQGKSMSVAMKLQIRRQ